MSWNSGGPDQPGPTPNPWGVPPGDGKGPREDARPGADRGADKEPLRGPWSGRPRGPAGAPDLEEAIAAAQTFLRGLFGGSGGGQGGGRRGPSRFAGGRGAALIAAGLVLIWLASGFYRVEPNEQGVVLRFGAFTRTSLPGLNYHIPWPVESVLTPAVTDIKRVEVGYRSAVNSPLRDLGGQDFTHESLMLTGDENIVDIDFAVFWRIRDAGAYLFGARNVDETVRSVAESVMRQTVGRTPITPILTSARAQIETDVLAQIQEVLDLYGTGVEVTQVVMQRVEPPADVIESFRDVQRASTDADTARNEAESVRNDIIPRARGEAATIVAGAEAERQAGIARASGEGQRFLSVLKAYQAAKDVTLKRLYIETMQNVLSHAPATVVDDRLRGIVPFLPLTPDASRATSAAGMAPGSASGATP